MTTKKNAPPKTPSHRMEDLGTIKDNIAAARAAIEISEYARARDRQAMAVRDDRIRAANEEGVTKTDIAKELGLSMATVRVICRATP